ncbi:hypothetical protein L1887_07726 [Cichorium endivia]|nr:hypothetical protein L1887_07725 [Cichorium endivia]KAI3518871.1 hypothetical protein L1887_07726 [Cichorium endivia]
MGLRTIEELEYHKETFDSTTTIYIRDILVRSRNHKLDDDAVRSRNHKLDDDIFASSSYDLGIGFEYPTDKSEHTIKLPSANEGDADGGANIAWDSAVADVSDIG